jgi:hypothetical protein
MASTVIIAITIITTLFTTIIKVSRMHIISIELSHQVTRLFLMSNLFSI